MKKRNILCMYALVCTRLVKGNAAFGDHSNGNMVAQHDASSASSDAVLGSDAQQSEAALDLLGSLSTQGDYSPFCLLIKKSQADL